MTTGKKIVLNEEQALQISRALADPHRYSILKQMRECKGMLPCAAIRDCTCVSPATLSHHMKELETAGLVNVIREGRNVSYELRQDVLDAFMGRLKSDLL